MTLEQTLTFWIPAFTILFTIVYGLLKYSKIRSEYQIKKMNQTKKSQKESETFGGAINDLIDTAPANLSQIESEIATIKSKALQTGTNPEQLKVLLSRLESEKDLLKFATKYGKIFKPLGGTVGKLLEKVLGGLGGV